MRYAHKFVVVGLVLLVPLALVVNAYVAMQYDRIDLSEKEQVGVEYALPLIVLVDRVVDARHEAVAADGDHEVTLSPAVGGNLAAAIAAMDDVDARHGTTLGTTSDWRSSRSALLAAKALAGSPNARFNAYNEANDALLALLARAGDESNLTLDPDLDTYYLMDMMQFRLPAIIDGAGRSADRAALAVARGAGDRGVFIDLGLASGALTSNAAAIGRAARTVVATTGEDHIRDVITTRFRDLQSTLNAWGSWLAAAVTTETVVGVTVASAEPVEAAATGFAGVVGDSLDDLLGHRIDEFRVRAHRVEIGAAGAALLGVYLFVGFYLSVAHPIRRIVETLHDVAAGNLSRRVKVDTHDELSFIANALNDTLTKNETVTERLSVEATHDSLTALPNRGVVLDRLEDAMREHRRFGTQTAVLFIDLDRFKIINDSLGHEAGDEVLQAVADRLTGMVRREDCVARLAGDEFVVISQGIGGLPDAVRLGERIVEALSRSISLERERAGRVVTVGASVGVTLIDGSTALRPEDLLRDADMAMYQAKERGRGQVAVFDDAMREAVQGRLEVQDELRKGIAEGQLRVHYQPIVHMTTGLLGFEALVRWQHPTRGLLGPGAFMPIAEEAGLVVPLGAVVLAQACRQAAEWRATRPGCERLYVSVNVSGVQFGHPSFVPTVADVLAETELTPEALWLEITETSIMTDAAETSATLDAVRALGVHLAIDDFGTGYSSLAYLRRFPVEVLKIDRSFVNGLGQDREDEAIVAMIIGLAHTLDLLVVAEGVETQEQVEELRRMGCNAMQGFLFAKPSAPEIIWHSMSLPTECPVGASPAAHHLSA